MHLEAVGWSGRAAAPAPRLVRAAHEFEGQMMKELLKPLTAGADEDGQPGASGALGEFAGEALGQALSAAGGFGVAERIVQQLSRSGSRSAAGKVTENLHVDTVLRGSE